MKVLVVLLGLITATLLSGVAAVTAQIRAYNATGELDISPIMLKDRDALTMGTRVLLTCDLSLEGIEVLSYRWYHKCTAYPDSRCEIRDADPYYRVVNDTLLVDVTSWDQGGRYYCVVHYLQGAQATTFTAVTLLLSVAGNPVPFLYTPTSLLPEHSVLTDVPQETGRNGQQWITCRSGRDGGLAAIHGNVSMSPTYSMGDQTATLTLTSQNLPENGHYYCLAGERKYNFNLFLRKQNTLPTPSIRTNSNREWHIASPDGSRVKRYIVEFECSVRNITFVETYMSVSASGGTGRVATSVSCFGGLGQLYRVKVWAVSGPNISRALVCIPDGQCREEGGNDTPTSDQSPFWPSTTMQPDGTFTAVGVGVGVFLLFVISILVVIILVVAVVRRKVAYKEKRDATMGDNLYYSNTVLVNQEIELKEKVVGAEYKDADGYEDLDDDNGEEEGPIAEGFDPYEVVDRKVHIKNVKTPAPTSAPPTSTTNVPHIYAIVDKSKKKGTKKETEDGCTATNNYQYAMPMIKMGKTTDKGEGVVESGGVEDEQYDDAVGFGYEPKADIKVWQPSEEGSKC